MLRFLWVIFVVTLSIVSGIFGLQAAEYFMTLSAEMLKKATVATTITQLPSYFTWLVPLAFVTAGILLGGLLASIAFRHLVRLASSLGKMPANDIMAGIAGVLSGLVVTYLVSPLVTRIPIGIPLLFITGIVFSYLGVNLMMGIKGELGMLLRHGVPETAAPPKHPKILDTNVIIDGRIADICRAGFLEGQIYVPGFVLDELQHIADSGDSLKRARGRRGLDVLNAMQKEHQLVISSHDVAFDETDEVDGKLVKLAKALDGYVVTNDFNLAKVAQLQGVQVLNVNELANALKPVVLPGEELTVTIIKEGKESNQGIAYLDDGTMIVVEGARKFINETVPVIVTSVLQTVAGKMIFANVKSMNGEEDDILDQNLRSYSSGRPRKKIQ